MEEGRWGRGLGGSGVVMCGGRKVGEGVRWKWGSDVLRRGGGEGGLGGSEVVMCGL